MGDTLVVRMAARYQLDYGRLRLWGSLSFALVAILSGLLWQRVGYGPMFFVAGALFLPVAAAAALLDEPVVVKEATRLSVRQFAGDNELMAILGAAVLVGSAIGMDIVFAGIIMERLGGNASMIGLLLGVAAFSELPAMHYGISIARRLGSRSALLIAFAALGLGLAGFALAWSPWHLLLVSVLRGFGFGVFFVGTVQSVDERVPPQWSGSVQAVLNAGVWGFAPLVAGPMSGVLYDAWGIKAVYVAATITVVLAAAVLVAAPVARHFKARLNRLRGFS